MAFTPPPPHKQFQLGSTASASSKRKPIGGGGGGPSQPGRPTNPAPAPAPAPAPSPSPSPAPSPPPGFGNLDPLLGSPAQRPPNTSQPGTIGGVPIPGIEPDDVHKEWYAPGRRFVGPSGSNLLAALFGGRADQPFYGDFSGVGSLLPGPDNDPFYQAREALQWIIGSGKGNIPDATAELLRGSGDASARYGDMRGMPSFLEMMNFNGEGDEVFGGYGPIQALLGRVVGQQGTTGWRDRDTGMPIGTTQSDIFRSFIQSTLAGGKNPLLDPESNIGLSRAMEASSPFAQPSVQNQLLKAMQIEGGVPTDLADSYIAKMMQGGMPNMLGISQRLVDDTSDLTNSTTNRLMRNIDTEAQRTLADQLPEVRAAMEASGMGRSGAAGLATSQLFGDVMEQANRDKQSLLGQFAESSLARNASAISQAAGLRGQGELQGSQQVGSAILGAQGLSTQAAEGMKGRLQQMLGQAFGQQFDSNEGARQAERALLQQGLGRAGDIYQGDQQRLVQMLLGGEGMRQQGLASEAGIQQNALAQYMQMYGMGEGAYESNLQRMLGLAEQQRLIKAQQQAGTLEAMMLPLQMMMQLSTGSAAPVYSTQQSQNPWISLGAGLLGQAGGGIMNQLIGGGQPAVDLSQYASWDGA